MKTLGVSTEATGSVSHAREFRRSVLRWYSENGRDFPWRHTRDPYHILVAELMLHRTRADQVTPVYRRFVSEYPDVRAFLHGDARAIESILRPLGLRWRTRLVFELREYLSRRPAPWIPVDYVELRELPGVSHYIASAIGCFGYGRPELLLDTNIVRVVGRFTGEQVTDSSRRSARFRSLLGLFLDHHRPREFYFGLIDLASLVCTPRKPHCPICPLNAWCDYPHGVGRNA